jgi:hypothetical protein
MIVEGHRPEFSSVLLSYRESPMTCMLRRTEILMLARSRRKFDSCTAPAVVDTTAAYAATTLPETVRRKAGAGMRRF